MGDERAIATRLLREFAQRPWLRGQLAVELVSWDDPAAPVPLAATEPPQATINACKPRPSECDLTLAIVWGRLGSPIAGIEKPGGGRYESGTQFEIDDARRASKPVWLYRRTEKPRVDVDDDSVAEKRRPPTCC